MGNLEWYPSPSNWVEDYDNWEECQFILANCTSYEREIIECRFHYGLEVDEIAKRIGCSRYQYKQLITTLSHRLMLRAQRMIIKELINGHKIQAPSNTGRVIHYSNAYSG